MPGVCRTRSLACFCDRGWTHKRGRHQDGLFSGSLSMQCS
jgi:hypothetical protein